MENCQLLLKPLRIGSLANGKLKVLVFTNHAFGGLEIQKARASVRFVELENSFDTASTLIIGKTKLVKLLMLYCISS